MSQLGQARDNRGYFQLIAAGEPFRLLFPVGCLLGLLGVFLWPAFVWGFSDGYPVIGHPRIMIQGFLTAFIVGFLGTALPRLLEVPRMSGLTCAGFAAAVLTLGVFHALHWHLAGDLVFTGVLGGLLIFLARRFPKRRDNPPPGFVLVGMGLASALAGVVILVLETVQPTAVAPVAGLFGRLLLQEGYLLLPIMGIGAFLLPRFFGLPNRQSFPESRALPPGWKPRAFYAGACGGLVLVSFALEACGVFRAAYGLRALAVVVYFAREVPVHKARFNRGSLALSLRAALFFIPVGYLCMAVWPHWQGTLNHLVFITGFGLLTFTVASRVVLGHGGLSSLFDKVLPSVLVLLALTLLATLTRIAADGSSTMFLAHYAHAAIIWMVGVMVWAVRVLPAVLRPDEE